MCEKPNEWLPCLVYQPKSGNRPKDWLIVNKTFKVSDGAPSLPMWDNGCNQIRQITFMFSWMLGSDSKHHAFYQSAHYHMAARLKACENVSREGRFTGNPRLLWVYLYKWLFILLRERKGATPEQRLSDKAWQEPLLSNRFRWWTTWSNNINITYTHCLLPSWTLRQRSSKMYFNKFQVTFIWLEKDKHTSVSWCKFKGSYYTSSNAHWLQVSII